MNPKATENAENRLYRIGEFAKYMGVTHDFLKHYEQLGFIKPVQTENGYRYYRFQDAVHIFECIRLKNQGFTLRAMEPLLTSMTEDEVIEAVQARGAELEKEYRFQTALMAAEAHFRREQTKLGPDGSNWKIDTTEPMLFLPHSQSRSFIDDPRIYDILPHWERCIPAVCSAALLSPEKPGDFSSMSWYRDCVWGLITTKRVALELELPVNGSVIELPAGKALSMHFSAHWNDGGNKDRYAAFWRRLDSFHLNPKDRIIKINYMTVQLGGNVSKNQWYIAPLDGVD